MPYWQTVWAEESGGHRTTLDRVRKKGKDVSKTVILNSLCASELFREFVKNTGQLQAKSLG